MTLPPGVVCSLKDYERSLISGSISCLSRDASIGLTVIIEGGLLSLLSILYVLLIIGRNVIWRVQNMSTARWRIFHQPMDILMFSLLFGDTIQAIGMVLSIKWVQDGKVEEGAFCTTQGMIKSFGATGVALSTLAIALYTFIGVWMMKGVCSMRRTLILVLGIWAFVAILGVIGLGLHSDPSKPSFMSPTPYWCWVNAHYLEWRVLGEYLWMWITLFLSLLCYIWLHFWTRGMISFKDSTWWKFSFSSSSSELAFPHSGARRRRSLVMLLYPVVYCLGIMPLSVIRWITFVQEANGGRNTMSPTATLASDAVFALSGFFNVILLLTTKPASGLFGQLMFISPAPPPPADSDLYRGRRSVEDRLRNLPLHK